MSNYLIGRCFSVCSINGLVFIIWCFYFVLLIYMWYLLICDVCLCLIKMWVLFWSWFWFWIVDVKMWLCGCVGIDDYVCFYCYRICFWELDDLGLLCVVVIDVSGWFLGIGWCGYVMVCVWWFVNVWLFFVWLD